MNSQQDKWDSLCELKHLWEVDMWFAENTGQRLNIAKFPRIIGERKRERERKRESGPAAFPWIPLIWSYGPCSVDLSHHFPTVTKPPRAHIVFIKDINVWISLIWFGNYRAHLVEVFTTLSCAGVMWITHSGYLSPCVGLTMARSFEDIILKVWVPFLVLLGFFCFIWNCI